MFSLSTQNLPTLPANLSQICRRHERNDPTATTNCQLPHDDDRAADGALIATDRDLAARRAPLSVQVGHRAQRTVEQPRRDQRRLLVQMEVSVCRVHIQDVRRRHVDVAIFGEVLLLRRAREVAAVEAVRHYEIPRHIDAAVEIAVDELDG